MPSILNDLSILILELELARLNGRGMG